MKKLRGLEIQDLCQAVLCLNSFSWTHVLGFFVLINFLTEEERSGVNQQQFKVHQGMINFIGNSNTWEKSKETLK